MLESNSSKYVAELNRSFYASFLNSLCPSNFELESRLVTFFRIFDLAIGIIFIIIKLLNNHNVDHNGTSQVNDTRVLPIGFGSKEKGIRAGV